MGVPFLTGIIPADTYKNQTANVETARIINFLVTHKDVPEATVYQMTKLFYENIEALKAAHSAAKDIDLKNAASNPPFIFHPGASKYYKEKGLIK
jgi:hypothetical protein